MSSTSTEVSRFSNSPPSSLSSTPDSPVSSQISIVDLSPRPSSLDLTEKRIQPQPPSPDMEVALRVLAPNPEEAAVYGRKPEADFFAPPPVNPIVEKLQIVVTLSKIKTLFLSYTDFREISLLLRQLPLELEVRIRASKSNSEALQCIDLLLQGNQISRSRDLGGHGGTSKAAIQLPQGMKYLFLKPKDEVEYRNYKILNSINPELAKFMPKIYGEIEIEGKVYVIMDNVRFDSQGNELEQLVDIKLAGRLPIDTFNPIACQEEMLATRGVEKSWFDFMQMASGAKDSPDYMIAAGLIRYLNYSHSEENLLASLQGTRPEHILQLTNDLLAIKVALEDGPAALIGSSVILVRQADGSIKPVLIDPAHIVVSETEKEEVREYFAPSVRDRIYFSTPRFSNQLRSNCIAINSMVASLFKLIPQFI